MFSCHAIELITNEACPFLRKPRLAAEVEQPTDVQAGLVAMVIGTCQTTEGIYHLSSAKHHVACHGKNGIETVVKQFLTHTSDKT